MKKYHNKRLLKRKLFTTVILLIITTTIAILFSLQPGVKPFAEARFLGIVSDENQQKYSEQSQKCFEYYENNQNQKETKQISLATQAIKESGIIQSGQFMPYKFKAKSGQTLRYKTTDNICIGIYTHEKQLLQSNKLPHDGEYTILVSTLQGRTTFDLELSLDTVQSSPPPAPSFSRPSVPTFGSILPPKPTNFTPPKPTNFAPSLMGHLYYQEAEQNRLTIIASYAQQQYQRFENLDQEAAKALMKLIYAARDEGVWIIPVSGFRDVKRQKLLFDEQIARLGSAEAAAKVSAPPGYSEHHTGYAVDLADGRFPKQDITNAFVDTDAYRWLNQHAKEYGFEMSFPLNNSQGVMFEPWHWRFIGSPPAATIFSKVTDSQYVNKSDT